MTNRMYNNDIDKFAGILNDNDPLKVINIDSKDIDNAGNAKSNVAETNSKYERNSRHS